MILRTVDLPSNDAPAVACETARGWLVVRFCAHDFVSVQTPDEDDWRAIGDIRVDWKSMTINGVSYNGSTVLRPHGWGAHPDHLAFFLSARRAREEETGWLDRAFAASWWWRAGRGPKRPTDSARKKLRALVEDVAEELLAVRPELVGLGAQADIRRQIVYVEDELLEIEQTKAGMTAKLADLHTDLRRVSDGD